MVIPLPLFQKEEPRIPATEKEIARKYIEEWVNKPDSTEKTHWALLGRRLLLEGISTEKWKFVANSREVQEEELRRLEKAIRSNAFAGNAVIQARVAGFLLSRILREIPEDAADIAVGNRPAQMS